MGYESISSIVLRLTNVEEMVSIFSKSDGFVTHRRSNQEDLTIKYDYLYSLAHKVMAEAYLIDLKRKHEPD